MMLGGNHGIEDVAPGLATNSNDGIWHCKRKDYCLDMKKKLPRAQKSKDYLIISDVLEMTEVVAIPDPKRHRASPMR
jgi:hypothetical protein